MAKAVLLGTGSSGGVPRIGNVWGACDPTNPKNRRRRCSLYLEKVSERGKTRTVIDAGPDFREQMLMANVDALDALVISHEHADHIHGIDDVRQITVARVYAMIEKRRAEAPDYELTSEDYIAFSNESRLITYAGLTAHDALMERFGYLFSQAGGSLYPPILEMRKMPEKLTIDGEGGSITMQPFPVHHGSIDAYGFRIGDCVYLPDVSEIPETSMLYLMNAKTLIIDCLQYREHKTHFNFDKAMALIEDVKPQHGILTNLHVSLDYDELNARTPSYVEPAFDGMDIEIADDAL